MDSKKREVTYCLLAVTLAKMVLNPEVVSAIVALIEHGRE